MGEYRCGNMGRAWEDGNLGAVLLDAGVACGLGRLGAQFLNKVTLN